MIPTLPQVAHEHHERLTREVDRIPGIADRLLTDRAEAVRASVAELSAFLTGTLVPHVDAAEASLYPELERMFQNRHSMAPMRREHEAVRRLVREHAALARALESGPVTLGRTLALRRVLFRLYALLKVHLAEEEAYLRIVDRSVSTDVADLLAAALEHPVAG